MTAKKYLVTGGTGFLGSAIVRDLVSRGHFVRVLDNNSRGSSRRLEDGVGDVDMIVADLRDREAVLKACRGMDSVLHLGYINGTEFFYSMPDTVLEVGVAGMLNVLAGCQAASVPELVLASSSEVYQTPPSIPTDEAVPLSVPDPLNPRYSYGGGKIISELLALNYGIERIDRVVVFRPHNVYGPDMGWEHVIPQFAMRMSRLAASTDGCIDFPIQGTGRETRSFIFIDDFVSAVSILLERAEHRGIYNVGTMDEIAISDVVALLGRHFQRDVMVVPGPLQPGGTLRRCPDTTKLKSLGWTPRIPLEKGLAITADWYSQHAHLAKPLEI